MQNAIARLRSRVSCVLLTTLLAGCAGGSSGASRGVPEWTLSSEPTLTIGSDSIPEQIFGSIGWVMALGDGQVAVLDVQTTEIRLFESDGSYLRTLTRQGNGPGEFTAVDWIQRHGDTLLVKDLFRGGVTLLSADGAVHRMVAAGTDSVYRSISLEGRIASGRWLASSRVPRGGPRVEGLNQDTMVHGLLSSSAVGPFQPIARTLGMPLVVAENRGSGPARFRRSWIVLPLADRIAVVDPDSGVVRLFSNDAVETGAFLVPVERTALTPEMMNEAQARRLARLDTEQARMLSEALHAIEPKPAFLPVVREVFADGANTLWFEEYWLDPDAPRRYHIVRDDGTALGVLHAPARFRLHNIGPDWVLGVQDDADGVPQVVRYGLTRR